MSAVWPGPARPDRASQLQIDATHGPSTVMHHLLDGLAGFHASEVEALTTVRQLAESHGLQADQLVLLTPRDAAWWRFAHRARQWNRRPHGQGGTSMRSLSLVAMLTAFGASLATAAVLEQNEFVSFELELAAMATAALVGAILAASLAVLLHQQQPQFKDFDRTIRHKLAQGHWVVLVHDLPWTRQAGVVDVINRHSANWIAVTSARQSR